jgi:aldehyde dehydrogenase (NAD+)
MKIIDKLFINGAWQSPAKEDVLQVTNPTSGEVFLQVPSSSEEDVQRAVAAAKNAFNSWSTTTAATRADYMNRIADAMEQRYDELVEAHVNSMGCPRHLTGLYHVDTPIEAMRYYAELATTMDNIERKDKVMITKEAVGVCAFINPWNYPLHQLIGKVAPALAVGCTIIAKPAEQTPELDFIMAQIFEAVGLPAGVFNLISGEGTELGPVLCAHPGVDMVSFTGSTRAGIQVAKAAAPSVKRVCQELGGKSAFIITEDADVATAVRYGVEDMMANTGQTCNALTRMLVPKRRYQEALSLATEIAAEQIVGDPNDDQTTMGPMASFKQMLSVQNYIQLGIDEGARLICGGLGTPAYLAEHLKNGAFVRPTIFADVTNSMRIAREEIFGPVLCIMAYDDIESAIDITNDNDFGLSSAVFAKDEAAAMIIAKRIKAGQCYIQGAYFSLDAPFGGYKQSGNGREWGEQSMHEYIETKAIICG